MFEHSHVFSQSHQIEGDLKSYSEDGWELVAVCDATWNTCNGFTLFFKRPKPAHVAFETVIEVKRDGVTMRKQGDRPWVALQDDRVL